MLNCKHASKLASRALDEKLPIWQIITLKMHLLLCRSCAHFSKQLNLMHQTAQGSTYINQHYRLSTKAKQKILQSLTDNQSKTIPHE